jgi:hypothetical protein
MIQFTMFFELFQGTRNIGWSEQIVTGDATIEAANAPNSYANVFLAKRCALFGSGVENTYNRLQSLVGGVLVKPLPRRSTLPMAGLPPASPIAGTTFYNTNFAAEPADFGQTDLLLRITSNPAVVPQYTRSYWLAGIPDAFTSINNPNVLPGNWQAPFNAWSSQVTNGNYFVRAIDRSGANPVKPCTAFTVIPPLQYTVPGHGFLSNQYVEALGWRGPSGSTLPRGFFTITVVDANTIQLQGSGPTSSNAMIGGFRSVSIIYQALNTVISRSWTNHKKGRPFGELRGRARTPTRSRA